MLVPVEHVVNGVSIVQCEAVERVASFHVELDSHDVIVAEGAAAETFVDCDSRLMFHNAVEFAVFYPGEDAPRWASARRASLVAARSGRGLLSERTAGAQPRRQERVLIPP